VSPASPFSPSSPSSPSGGANDSQVSAIAAKVSSSVVDINTKLNYQGASAAGTGMVLTSSGDILTNNHVIDGSTSISVTLVDTGRSYTAKVVGTDPTADIAVIRLQGASGLKPINTTVSTPVALGDSVIAIGNAGGVGGAPSVVTGTVSATDQTITASDPNGANAEQLSGLIQTNAPIQPGDSGGPLVNSAGQVIGVNTAASSRNRFDSTASVGFAIPLANAVSVARQIESGVATTTVHIGLPGFLGVAVDPSTGAAVVAGVQSGSPASTIGLVAGDTITAVDGKAISSPDNLTTILRAHHPGDKVSIRWTTASGATHTATATLMTGPAD
jgi:S1-C subfamily serine protease